jgi:hypothetical protein
MTTKLKISTLLFGFHLLLSILFASHYGEWGIQGKLSSFLLYEGEFTGSSNIYSFFAPRVGDQTSVLYTLGDNTGEQKKWLLSGKTPEINTRIATAYNFLRLPDGGKLFSRNFGNTALRLNPTASVVRVCVIQQTMPSLIAYRDSAIQPRWEPVFTFDYKRNNE